MKEHEVNQCQIQEWYPKFKSDSIKTLIHELPESFIDYLLDDSGLFLLPLSMTNEDPLPNRINKPQDKEDFYISESSEDESEHPSSPPVSFPELEIKIKESIQTLGGSVFPKLNWSAPKDTAWMSTSCDLKCTSFSEIALLFKSSDSLVHDLCHAYDCCEDKMRSRPLKFYLAVRKWYPSLRPEMEFRCFVKDGRLVGVCQREVTGFYPGLVEGKEGILGMVKEFFTEKVKGKFGLQSFTFDVYVTKDDRVKILDFNTWGGATLGLLFTWEELEEKVVVEEEEEEEEEFRVVESECGVRPGLKTAVPYDFLDTSPGSGWDVFLKKADEELARQATSYGA